MVYEAVTLQHAVALQRLILTQYIFGSQLSEILELEIDINDGHAAGDRQDDYITAVDFL